MADLPLWIAIALTLTAGVWFVAAWRDRIAGMPVGSGLVRGVIFAIVAGLLGALIIPGMIHLGFPVSVGMGGFVLIALLVFGIPAAIAFFWIGALLMPIGLLVTRRQSWPTFGAWVASVGAAILLLVGYVAYQGVKAAIDAPAIVTGTATIDISGRVLPRAMGSGAATCRLFEEGTFRVDVGIGFSQTEPILTADGRELTIQLIWPPDRPASVAIGIGGRASQVAQDGVMTIRSGSTPSSGTMDVVGILPSKDGDPDPTDPWTGTVSWECPLG